MKNEIRMAVALPVELEDQIFEMRGEAFELIRGGQTNLAVEKMLQTWDLLPEPKFNVSCSHIVLTYLVRVLNTVQKHTEAEAILLDWINDIENSGYKTHEMEPFILLAETYLFLKETDKAKDLFLKAAKYGASKRAFSDHPAFYFDIAKKKITDNKEIENLFQQEGSMQQPAVDTQKVLTDEASEKIDELSEQGNALFDEENYTGAIKIWQEALALIPQPQNTYSESLWLETSIGDAFFMSGEFKQALLHFHNAKSNIEENAYENPFIMLRLGQCCVENNLTKDAKEYLLRAYMAEGKEIFEHDESKYFEFLEQNVALK